MEQEKVNVTQTVCDYLHSLPVFSYVDISEVYKLPGLTAENEQAVMTALRRYTAGTNLFKKEKPKKFYAIRLPLPEEGYTKDAIYLSLKGIETKHLVEDDQDTGFAKGIIDFFEEKYKKPVINYWVRAAQYRSVDLIHKASRLVKTREGSNCRVCEIIRQTNLYAGTELAFNDSKGTTCHIISRHTIFWKTLLQVHEELDNIFTEAAVIRHQTLLSDVENQDTKYHSSPDYMVCLCRKHDRAIQDVLQNAL